MQTNLLTLLDGGLTVGEITEVLGEKGYDIDIDDVLHILNQLYEYKIVEDNLLFLNDETISSEVKTRFDRQLLFSALDKKVMKVQCRFNKNYRMLILL